MLTETHFHYPYQPANKIEYKDKKSLLKAIKHNTTLTNFDFYAMPTNTVYKTHDAINHNYRKPH